MCDNLPFALVVVSLLTCILADDGPKFIKNPEPIVAPLGDEVEFDCLLDIRADHLRWKHNGRLLPHVSNDTAKSQMTFKVNDESLTGDYQCVAWYGASAIASKPAKLSLAEIGPVPPKMNRSIEVSSGNNVIIKCKVPYSKPLALIQYYKNNKTIAGSRILQSGTLLLLNVTEKDNGVYSCSITNSYVQEDAIFLPSFNELIVHGKTTEKMSPRFFYTPQIRYNVPAGTNVTLECVGHGQPVPSHNWRLKNKSLPVGRHNVTAGGLQIYHVVPSDEGVYTCEIDNGIHPKLVHHFDLVVQEAPSVERGPSNLLVKEGEKAQLDCLIRGKPFPKITWLLNGESIRNDSHVVGNGSKILIMDVEKRHAGMYQCMAENALGSSFGSSTLRVEPRQVTVKDSFGSRFRETNGRTMMRQPEENKHKKSSKNKEMIPPTRPNVTRLTDRSVMVRWHVTPNKGLPILFFKVQHREMSKGTKGSRWMTNNENIPPHVGSYEVGNLTPNRYYRFRIAAVYANFDNKLSPNSARFCLRSSAGIKQVPAAPKLIHTSAASPESIRIVWEYQNNSKLPIEGFYVYYRSTSSAGEYLKATVDGEWTRSYVINFLNEDTAYDIKLQSFTVNAASEFSEIVTQKTEKIPTMSPPPEESTTVDPEKESNDRSKSGNQLYVTLGAVLGGLALLLMLCLGIFFCNRHRHTSLESQDNSGKSRRLQVEPMDMNGHIGRTNGHLSKNNGYLASSINITNNPLADAEDDKDENIMEISFITRTSTMTTTTTSQLGTLSHRNKKKKKGFAGQESVSKNRKKKKMETTTTTTTTMNNKKIEINRRGQRVRDVMTPDDSCSSGDESCESNEVDLRRCAMGGEGGDAWRTCDLSSVRTLENFV